MGRVKPNDLREWTRVELMEEVKRLREQQDGMVIALAKLQREARESKGDTDSPVRRLQVQMVRLPHSQERDALAWHFHLVGRQASDSQGQGRTQSSIGTH